MSHQHNVRPVPRFRPAASLLIGLFLLASLSILASRLATALNVPDLPSPAVETQNHTLAFASWREGNWDIFKMDADGSHVINLTHTPSQDVSPIWSPQGKQIAFISDRDQNWKVYVMGSDGSNLSGLKPDPLDYFGMAWSPDGQTLITNQSTLPTWSPDNRLLAYQDGSGIDLTDVSYHLTVRLVDTALSAIRYHMAWSPNGKYIALTSSQADSAIGHLYLLDYNPLALISLSDIPVTYDGPSWSPDSEQIAFISERDGNPDIYSIRVDGSGLTNLTHSIENESFPDWSPDGKFITFNRLLVLNWQIFVMNADGSHAVQLTSDHSDNLKPKWQP